MKNFKILFLSASILSVTSCKKVMEVKETDLIAGDVALQTVNNNNQAIVGAYGGIPYEMAYLWNAVVSDEAKVGEFYNSQTVHEWGFSPTDIPIRDQFLAINPYYRVIDRVNRVLKALPNAQALQGASDEALRTRLKGEALFLRAFAHFEIARYYTGNYDPAGLAMPYMEGPSVGYQARIAMGPYYQKINADLAEAKNLLPSSLTDVGRANKTAVAGMQARVALYMRDWPNAITYSTEYINALPLASRTDFPGIWTDANNSEVAFELKRTSSVGARVGNLFRNQAPANAVVPGTLIWIPTDELWNSYDQTNDIRFSSYLKTEPGLAALSRPSRFVHKYSGTGAYGSNTENVADVKVLRTGEMYLIRAEAKAETNDLPGAAQDINTLRAARIAGYTNVAFASKQDAIDAILLERYKELAFEGHRFWDLRRRNLPVERLASDAPNATSRTLPAGNFRFLLPIPLTEMNANPLMQQNPGYN